MTYLVIDQKTNISGFPKPSELIELTGTSGLEAQDRILLNTLYRHAHDSGSLATPGAHWSIPMTACRNGAHNGNERLRKSLGRLLGIQVVVTFQDDQTGEAKVLQTVLFEYFETSKIGGSVSDVLEFSIPEKLRKILVKSSRWGRIKAEIVCAMSSKYAIALYELLRLRAKMDNCIQTFPIERFRSLLGVPPGTYAKGLDFQRKVIDPAVLEINGLSDLGCSIKLDRAHARAPVTAATVTWWPKDPEENRVSMQELNRSKLGRMARLRGQVETLETA